MSTMSSFVPHNHQYIILQGCKGCPRCLRSFHTTINTLFYKGYKGCARGIRSFHTTINVTRSYILLLHFCLWLSNLSILSVPDEGYPETLFYGGIVKSSHGSTNRAACRVQCGGYGCSFDRGCQVIIRKAWLWIIVDKVFR